MPIYETSTGTIVKGDPISLPVVAVVWKGSEKAGWKLDGKARIIGEVSRLGEVRGLLLENRLRPRDGRGTTSTPHVVGLPIAQDEQRWPAYVQIDVVSVVRREDDA